MNYCFITLRSLTMAQKAETLLRRNGISCTLQRTPRWMEEQGCGYCIRFWYGNPEKVPELLRRNQIPFRRVYRQTAEGSMEEIML